jgi:DNA-binding transcriptional LysR family regulator
MNLLEFDMNLLLTFDAIYRHHSLSAAAIELGLTQPAVSAALKRLRERFDNPLFVRTSHGMRPTPYADNMSAKITRALDILREVDQEAQFTPQTSTINFRVYINDIGMLLVMPLVLKYMSEHAPGARLTILDLRPDEVVDALDRGTIDLAVGYFLGMPNWAHQQSVRNTSYVCAVRKDHPQIHDSLSLEQFLNASHAMYWTSGSPHSAVEEALARLDLTRDVTLRLPRFSAVPFFIAQSDLIATIPEDLGQAFSGLINIKVFKPPLKLPNFEIRQYWHERHHADPANKWLRRIVKSETANMVRMQPR